MERKRNYVGKKKKTAYITFHDKAHTDLNPKAIKQTRYAQLLEKTLSKNKPSCLHNHQCHLATILAMKSS